MFSRPLLVLALALLAACEMQPLDHSKLTSTPENHAAPDQSLDAKKENFWQDPRTWTAIAAFGFSLVSFVWLLGESRKVRRRDATFVLYKHWTDNHMQQHRANAWEHLNKLSESKSTQKWSSLKGDPAWKGIGAIDHFIADLYSLLKADVIDKELACDLFGITILSYLQRFEELLEYDLPDERVWFETRMKPVRKYLIRSN